MYPTISDLGADDPDVLMVSDDPMVTDHVLLCNCYSIQERNIIQCTGRYTRRYAYCNM
jgi:hypothetical protein